MFDIPTKLASPANFSVTADIEDYQTMLDYQARRFSLFGPIYASGDDETCEVSNATRITQAIIRINRDDIGIHKAARRRILICINSGGGDPIEGFGLIAAIEASETPVDIVSFGRCMSTAFLISLAGETRYALPYTQFLLHDGDMVGMNSTKKLIDWSDFAKRYEEEVIKPYVLKNGKMTEEQYVQIERKEFYMVPEDALRYGFIDRIIESLDEIL